jgi:hypothetical protein
MKTLMLIMALGLIGSVGALYYLEAKILKGRAVAVVPRVSPVIVKPYGEGEETDISPIVTPSPEPTYPVTERANTISVDGCIKLDNFVDMWQAGGSIYQPFVIHLTNSCDFPVDTRMSITFYDLEGTRIGGTNIYVDNIPAKGRASEEAMAFHLPEAKYEYSFTNVLSR